MDQRDTAPPQSWQMSSGIAIDGQAGCTDEPDGCSMLTPAEMGGSCQRQKAVLVIAKLDRLARRVSFVSALMDGDVDFVTCDFPQANRLTLHMPAAVAEHERAMISERTKADRSEREKHLIPGIDIRRAAWQMIRRY